VVDGYWVKPIDAATQRQQKRDSGGKLVGLRITGPSVDWALKPYARTMPAPLTGAELGEDS
jgi:hypothetical protein